MSADQHEHVADKKSDAPDSVISPLRENPSVEAPQLDGDDADSPGLGQQALHETERSRRQPTELRERIPTHRHKNRIVVSSDSDEAPAPVVEKQRHSHSHKYKNVKIPLFSGAAHEDLDGWIDRIRTLAAYMGWSEEEAFEIASLHLSSSASKEFRLRKIDIAPDLSSLEAMLKDRFAPENYRRDCVQKFLQMRQRLNETPREYETRFREALLKAEAVGFEQNEEASVEIFIGSILDEYKGEFERLEVISLGQAYQVFRMAGRIVQKTNAYENRVAAIKVSRDHTSPSPDTDFSKLLEEIKAMRVAFGQGLDTLRSTFRAPAQSYANHTQTHNAHTHTGSPTQVRNVTQHPSNTEVRNPVRCHNRGRFGHIRRVCRQPGGGAHISRGHAPRPLRYGMRQNSFGRFGREPRGVLPQNSGENVQFRRHAAHTPMHPQRSMHTNPQWSPRNRAPPSRQNANIRSDVHTEARNTESKSSAPPIAALQNNANTKIFIVKIPVLAGSLKLNALVDTCAPCGLIRFELARRLVNERVAHWQGNKRHGVISLKSLNGSPLQLGPEVHLKFSIGGKPTNADLIAVHDCKEDMLLATDFSVEKGVVVDMRRHVSCVHVHSLNVSVPFVGSFRTVPAQCIPETLLFLNGTSFKIAPFTEAIVEVRHLLTDPLSQLSRDVAVTQYRGGPRSEFVVRDSVTRLENGIGSIIVVNPTAQPIFFDDNSVIALATSVRKNSIDGGVEELCPPPFNIDTRVASLALTEEQDF